VPTIAATQAAGSAAPDIFHAEDDTGEPDRGQHKSGKIERADIVLLEIVDKNCDQHDTEKPDRDIDEEDPAPRCIGDDEAAQRRPQNRPEHRRGGDQDHRAQEIRLRDRAQHDEAPDRRHHGTAGALDHAGDDEFRQRIGQPAGDRAQGEDDDGGAEHRARAETVGHPAAQRDEDRQAQQIGGDREIEPQHVFMEGSGDRRQRRGDDRRIEILHEERAGDDQRDDVLFGQRGSEAGLIR
jgi:hypothetical protein